MYAVTDKTSIWCLESTQGIRNLAFTYEAVLKFSCFLVCFYNLSNTQIGGTRYIL